MVELVVCDLTSKTQWIKHGCLKVNGVSRCSRNANVFEIHPRWFEFQHRAIFEAGFPPYKTPEATYPVCVQELTWPLLWEDVRFDLKTMCLSNDQGNRRFAILVLVFYFFSGGEVMLIFANALFLFSKGRHGTHQLCCTKPYAGEALTSPYFLNGKGGDNPEGIVRDLDNHWLKTDEEAEDDEAEKKLPLKYDFKQSEHSFPTFRPLDSSLSNVFESEDQSLGGISSLEDSFETDTPGNGDQPVSTRYLQRRII